MSDREWEFNADADEVTRAIGDALGLQPGESLLQLVGPRQVGVTYQVSEERQKVDPPRISGIDAYTRRVLVKVEIAERGLRKRLDEETKSQTLDTVRKVMGEVEAELVTAAPESPVTYERHHIGYDLGYQSAMWQDFDAGLLPFRLAGNVLTRISDRAEVGSLVIQTRKFNHEYFSPNAFTVDTKLTLCGVSEAEVCTMVMAMRAWIRGKALSDRLPLELPTNNNAGLQE